MANGKSQTGLGCGSVRQVTVLGGFAAEAPIYKALHAERLFYCPRGHRGRGPQGPRILKKVKILSTRLFKNTSTTIFVHQQSTTHFYHPPINSLYISHLKF